MSHFGSAITSQSATGGKPAALLVALMASAIALAGCARQQSPQEAHAGPARPQPAYCQPRAAPDCEFKNANLRTVDPTEFARLKLAYERRCIRHAEKAERTRIRELQASGACERKLASVRAAGR
jgi:hypothetical protein